MPGQTTRRVSIEFIRQLAAFGTISVDRHVEDRFSSLNEQILAYSIGSIFCATRFSLHSIQFRACHWELRVGFQSGAKFRLQRSAFRSPGARFERATLQVDASQSMWPVAIAAKTRSSWYAV
jgi:hypothetical protein